MDEKINAQFTNLAAAFPPAVRRLLVDGDSSVPLQTLLAELDIDPDQHLLGGNTARVLRVPDALDSSACAILRDAVDATRSTSIDSVDGGAEHQRRLSAADLAALVGSAKAERLLALPILFSGAADDSASSADGAVPPPTDIFVRRYTAEERPWNPFHHDAAAVTINVALNDDGAHGGGRLVALFDDRVATIERAEGEATVHDSRLLHAVTRTTHGVRHSLILFFGTADVSETAEEVEAFTAFLHTLPTARREQALAELEAREAPAVAALEHKLACLEAARAQAPLARAAIDRARAAVAQAEAARAVAEGTPSIAHADRELTDARAVLDEAVCGALAAREHHFQLQVASQKLRLRAVAARRDARAWLVSEYRNREQSAGDDDT